VKFYIIFPIAVIAVLSFGVKFGFRLNTTSSLPLGIYRQTSGIARGTLAMFCLEDEEFIKLAKERGYLGEGTCPGGVKPLGKEIFGLTGDQISLSGETSGQIAVNGQSIARSHVKNKDSHGRPMPTTYLTAGRIPSGFALMLSPHHEGGFDSRYFGLVRVSALTPVQPVFIWK
jgi:conjugative transfer signal peptidase TraF